MIAALHHLMRAKLYAFIRRERRPSPASRPPRDRHLKVAAFRLRQVVDVGLLHTNDLTTPDRGPAEHPRPTPRPGRVAHQLA